MDFFTQQDKARRYTRLLVFYFLIITILIMLAVNVVIYYFFLFLDFYPHMPEGWYLDTMVYYVSAGTAVLIVGGSLYRWIKLKSGGHVVADMVGATPLPNQNDDLKIRTFVNVVEEMSIASGVSVPRLYVQKDEQGINAFVAGYYPTEAVMVITQGALDHLNRDELQAVVAHEYSHILNGDMQINIKLIALLSGILLISVTGDILIKGSRRSVRGRSDSGFAALGFLLKVLGYLGVFCGRIVKAAVSRQREFLADAASVQFTRNPDGIASALYKIASHRVGSNIANPHAEDVSHMCFANVMKLSLSQWLATHPPIDIRINRVIPGYVRQQKTIHPESSNQSHQADISQIANNEDSLHVVPSQFVGSVGTLDNAHIKYAEEMHQTIDTSLMEACRQEQAAKLIVYSLFLARMDLQTGLSYLKSNLSKDELDLLNKYYSQVHVLKTTQRLPLFDILLSTLKALSASEVTSFICICEALVKEDGRYTLFEFVLLTILQQHLSSDAARFKKTRYFSYKDVVSELQILFSIMAWSCGNSKSGQQAYQSFSHGFSLDGRDMLPLAKITPRKSARALTNLSLMSPLLKRNVLEACADMAVHDGIMKVTEAELLRAISESLGCPLPPLLPDPVE